MSHFHLIEAQIDQLNDYLHDTYYNKIKIVNFNGVTIKALLHKHFII